MASQTLIVPKGFGFESTQTQIYSFMCQAIRVSNSSCEQSSLVGPVVMPQGT